MENARTFPIAVTLSAESSFYREQSVLPQRVLYSISARIGGSGLDVDALQTVRGLTIRNILSRALCYGNQSEISPALVRSLQWHPVRLLGFFASRRLGKAKHYYGAKRHYLDRIAARELASGRYDFFHGWSGECVRALRVAKARGIPSLIEIPTWHRDKGKIKPALTKSEREQAKRSWPRRSFDSLLVSRQQVLEEYQLADSICVFSERAAETFMIAGTPEEKLCYLPRGVDGAEFMPHQQPSKFRAVFVGALIKRKGVHHLLEAWHRAALPESELLLVGAVHGEMKPFLKQFAAPNVRAIGFVHQVGECLRTASVHVFPSTCEGSAKVTYEAAACGLPQITTREAGDVVLDGVNGLIVPAGEVEALTNALRQMYEQPRQRVAMGEAARARIEEGLTWDHFRVRLLEAYAQTLKRQRASSVN